MAACLLSRHPCDGQIEAGKGLKADYVPDASGESLTFSTNLHCSIKVAVLVLIPSPHVLILEPPARE